MPAPHLPTADMQKFVALWLRSALSQLGQHSQHHSSRRWGTGILENPTFVRVLGVVSASSRENLASALGADSLQMCPHVSTHKPSGPLPCQPRLCLSSFGSCSQRGLQQRLLVEWDCLVQDAQAESPARWSISSASYLVCIQLMRL